MAIDKERVLKDFGQCARCKQCRMVCEVPIATTMVPICPTGEAYKFDTFFATGRVTLAKKMLLGALEYDDSVLQAVYSCTLCGSCKQQCPILNFDPTEATVVMREIAVERGLADKVYSLPANDPIDVAAVNGAAETALFVGTVAQSDKAAVERVIAILKKAGVDFSLFAGADCGEYLLRKGDAKAFEEKKAVVTAAIKAAGIKKLIAHEPMTYKVLAQDYALAEQGVEVVYYLALVNDSFTGTAGKKAVFHDPSYLGRYMGVYDLPREILSKLGYEVVEMIRTRENAMTSGGFADAWPRVAEEGSCTILGDAADAGAELIVTSSHYATEQLKKTALKTGCQIEIKDISELLA